MSSGDTLSILINLAVGIYFALFYPRNIAKRFSGRPTPRAFLLMQRVVPPAGWLIILLTVLYALSLLLA